VLFSSTISIDLENAVKSSCAVVLEIAELFRSGRYLSFFLLLYRKGGIRILSVFKNKEKQFANILFTRFVIHPTIESFFENHL